MWSMECSDRESAWVTYWQIRDLTGPDIIDALVGRRRWEGKDYHRSQVVARTASLRDATTAAAMFLDSMGVMKAFHVPPSDKRPSNKNATMTTWCSTEPYVIVVVIIIIVIIIIIIIIIIIVIVVVVVQTKWRHDVEKRGGRGRKRREIER